MKTPDTSRWTVLALLFLGGMINYLDRSAIGVAAPFLSKQLSLTPSELGWVFSVFFFGYAAFCFVGGYAADRIGARNVFAIAAVVWCASRIHRVGILMYGKRPTFPEILRWIRHA